MNRSLELADAMHAVPPVPPVPPWTAERPEVSVRPPVVFVPPAWEYRHLVRDLAAQPAPAEEELNALGAEGWELVSVIERGPLAHFYFKRLVR